MVAREQRVKTPLRKLVLGIRVHKGNLEIKENKEPKATKDLEEIRERRV